MDMESSTVFWIVTLLMSVLAFSFVATPLLQRGHRKGIVGFGTALPAFAAGLYLFVGSPQAASLDKVDHTGADTKHSSTAETHKPVASVANLVDGLAKRLDDGSMDPTDGKNWLLLARSYEHVGRMAEARDAYNRAVALGEYDTGLAALADEHQSVSGLHLKGIVSLSADAQSIVLPTDSVFVFARAVDGPPVPVAAMQRPASALPFDFVLSDKQSMSADALLSSAETVTVIARVSRSGAVADALKGLEAKAPNITVADGEYLNLVIQ